MIFLIFFLIFHIFSNEPVKANIYDFLFERIKSLFDISLEIHRSSESVEKIINKSVRLKRVISINSDRISIMGSNLKNIENKAKSLDKELSHPKIKKHRKIEIERDFSFLSPSTK